MGNDFKKDWEFGSVDLARPGLREDGHAGIDAWVGGVPIAWRRLRTPITRYGQISIRRARSTGGRTEFDKIVNGDCKALFYFFQFPDAIVVCKMSSIAECLKAGKFIERDNRDGTTVGCYIKISDLTNVLIAETVE